MGTVMRRMSANDLQIFAAIMLGERKTRKAGFSFMQKVYIRVAGGAGRNYLGNFVLGYVLDATKETVRVVSETGRTAVILPNEKNSNSLYTVDQFRQIRIEIHANKAWVDPEIQKGHEKIARSIAGLDSADERGLFDTPVAQRRKIKKVKKEDDLVTFVSKLSRGVIKARKAESVDEEISIAW